MLGTSTWLGGIHRNRGSLCACLVALILCANHYCRDAPGTVEEQLMADPSLDISPSRYGILTAAYFAPSAFVPLGLGLISDVGGVPPEVVFLCSSWVGVTGHILAAAGAAKGSFPILLAGRGLAGAVYESIDMVPLGFLPQLVPYDWGTFSGVINGVLRLGSVVAFSSLPRVYDRGRGVGANDIDGDGDSAGSGTSAVFWAVALVGSVMGPLATVVSYVASGHVEKKRKCTGKSLTIDAPLSENKRGDGSLIDQRWTAEFSVLGDMISTLRSVPMSFWVYALGGMAMYASVIPFWFYGSGFLQRSHGLTLKAADGLMVLPEGMICILSTPIGVLVDRTGVRFPAQQRALAMAILCIMLSLVFLANETVSPILGVAVLGSSYAVANQLLWTGFPSACPKEISTLGAGIMACLINIGATAVPTVIGVARETIKSPEVADTAMLLFLASLALFGTMLASASASGILRKRSEREGYREFPNVPSSLNAVVAILEQANGGRFLVNFPREIIPVIMLFHGQDAVQI